MRKLGWVSGIGLFLLAVSAQAASDRSGTITSGGASQTVMGQNNNRHGCSIQNVSSGDLWVNDVGGSAVANQPSFKVTSGAMYQCVNGSGTAAITVLGATTGQAFAAREW